MPAYTVDERDRVREMDDLPQSCCGAPLPMVVASDSRVSLAYLLENRDPEWDGTTVRVLAPQSPGEPVMRVEFDAPYAHYLGAPNDEALAGHPLASRGLQPYGVFQVVDSSWVRALERMNRVHPYHNRKRFDTLRHYVFTFHDSTFECLANGFRWRVEDGPLARVVAAMTEQVCR